MVTLGRSPTTLCHDCPLSVDSNSPISVPAQIISVLCGITSKLYTVTSGNPFEELPETFK